MEKPKVRLFVSYAKSDELWKDMLVKHLAVLVREGTIQIWHDAEIRPGVEWDPNIRQRLEEANLIVFLVSPDFFASDYAWEIEFKRAMERHESRAAYIIPLIVRPVHWSSASFAKLQVLPKDGKPITSWTDPAEALADVTAKIALVAEDIVLGRMPGDFGREKQGLPAAGDPYDDEVSGMRFVWIPHGTYLMGWNSGARESFMDRILSLTDQGNAKPVHKVIITRGFWLGKFAVTQKVWTQHIRTNPSRFSGAERPVENVSWLDAHEFIKTLNKKSPNFSYRLPTEAEWEYAARADTTDPLMGAEPDEIAWFAGNSGEETHPVGQKKPNRWGLHDTIGNVWEWCSDWFDSDHNYFQMSPELDPRGPAAGSFRVSRGGAWYLIKGRLHVAIRQWHAPGHRDGVIGFRCVMEKKTIG